MTTLSSPPKATGKLDRLLAFAKLIRLPVSLLAGVAGYATCYALNPMLPWQQNLLTALVLVCMTAASCTINDYWDVDKDRINHPQRPLPAGQLSLAQAWWTAVLLFAAALTAALLLGVYPLLLVAASTILLWNYSHLLQYSGILGNAIVATTIALLVFLGSLIADRPFSMLYPIGFLFCYALAREIILDVHDAEGDRQQGVATIANQWGAETAFVIAWAVLGVLLLSLPIALLLLPMQHGIKFCGSAALLLLSLGIPLVFYQRHPGQTTYERLIFWERLGMLVGGLGLLGAAPAM